MSVKVYNIGNNKEFTVRYDEHQMAKVTREVIEQAFIPALKYREEYRWHDLSQNPDDLPVNAASLFVRIKIHRDEQVCEDDFRCIWRKENKWYFDDFGKEEVNWEDVINWKYIDTLPLYY